MQVEKQLEAVDISGKEDISNKLKAANDWTATPSDDKYLSEAFAKDKLVAKETGKGLSDKNFTAALETKLNNIAENAEVNVQSDWNQATNTADDYIKNKPTIPTVTNDFTNDYKTKLDTVKLPTSVNQTTSHTAAIADNGKLFNMNATTELDFTIPKNATVQIPIDFELAVLQFGTGAVNIKVVDGATINGANSTVVHKISGQYKSVALKKIGENTWLMVGAFEVVE